MCLGIPGELVELADDDTDLATVSVAGVRRKVNVGLLSRGARRSSPSATGSSSTSASRWPRSTRPRRPPPWRCCTAWARPTTRSSRSSWPPRPGGRDCEVRRRVPRRRHRPRDRHPHRRARRAGQALRLHGGVRRAHAHDLQARPRGPPARVDPARARARLPGLRAADGAGRRRDRHRPRPRRDHDGVRRHDARPRQRRLLLRRQGRGRRHPDGLLAARRPEDRAGEPGAPRGVHGHRLRDDHPVDGDDDPAGGARGPRELLGVLQPRRRHPADDRDPRLPRPAPRRLHRARATSRRSSGASPTGSSPPSAASRWWSRGSSRWTSCSRSTS